jgi:hypothetical protein
MSSGQQGGQRGGKCSRMHAMRAGMLHTERLLLDTEALHQHGQSVLVVCFFCRAYEGAAVAARPAGAATCK